jgi:hypothetical protein
MSDPSNGITPEIIRQIMPPYQLNPDCGFRRSRPGIPNVFRAPFQSDAAHQSNLMAPRMVWSRRPMPVMS